jgi:hypothetical protein
VVINTDGFEKEIDYPYTLNSFTIDLFILRLNVNNGLRTSSLLGPDPPNLA